MHTIINDITLGHVCQYVCGKYKHKMHIYTYMLHIEFIHVNAYTSNIIIYCSIDMIVGPTCPTISQSCFVEPGRLVNLVKDHLKTLLWL